MLPKRNRLRTCPALRQLVQLSCGLNSTSEITSGSVSAVVGSKTLRLLKYRCKSILLNFTKETGTISEKLQAENSPVTKMFGRKRFVSSQHVFLACPTNAKPRLHAKWTHWVFSDLRGLYSQLCLQNTVWHFHLIRNHEAAVSEQSLMQHFSTAKFVQEGRKMF